MVNRVTQAIFQASLLLTIIGVVIVLFAGVVEPYKRVFPCHDQAIRKKFHENTVQTRVLLALCLAVPLLVIKFGEFWLSAAEHHRNLSFANQILHWLRPSKRSFHFFLDYLFGFLIVASLMHIGKSTTGVLRPHFVDVCRPNFSSPTLQECKSVPGGYVDDPLCMNTNARAVKIARESFPSGHAACSVYALAFVYFYLRIRLSSLQGYLFFKQLSLLAFGLFAFVTCLTRVTDHWHHPTDVLGGVVLGLGVAYLLFATRDGSFSRRALNEER